MHKRASILAIQTINHRSNGIRKHSNQRHLLGQILKHSDIPRIRLASVEPWDLADDFFELFENPRLMPHMHLPIQSGCDSVLRRMARRCKTAEFARLVEQARSAIPLFNVTTDLIAGFPGETEQEWRQTLEFIASVESDKAMFKARAMEVGMDLMLNSKSEAVRARMVEFFASDGKVSPVSVHIDARQTRGYEYAHPGQKVVEIVDTLDPNR